MRACDRGVKRLGTQRATCRPVMHHDRASRLDDVPSSAKRLLYLTYTFIITSGQCGHELSQLKCRNPQFEANRCWVWVQSWIMRLRKTTFEKEIIWASRSGYPPAMPLAMSLRIIAGSERMWKCARRLLDSSQSLSLKLSTFGPFAICT